LLRAPHSDSTVGETVDLLPGDTPVHVALEAMARHFGDRAGLSNADIVFERANGNLTEWDLAAIEILARQLRQSRPSDGINDELRDVSIRTPADLMLAGSGNPLVSQDGQAALISISLPYNFITKHAAHLVKHFQEVLAATSLPPGLTAAVTGSAGYRYDYAVATERSHQKTMVVTLVSVILILLIIYRAPIAAMIPLVCVSMAAGIVMSLLTLLEQYGLHSGTAERIFTFVLLYGAGIDYSLLFISRFREFLNEGRPSAKAMVMALNASVGTIALSATMTLSGLVMLCLAQFGVFRNAGPAICLALIVAAMAAATLVPAMIAIVGDRLFWPWRPRTSAAFTASGARSSGFVMWTWIADRVVARPMQVLVITLAVLILPAIRGSQIDWNYDALYSLKPTYQARRGTEMAERHWPIGETAPVNVLVVSARPQTAAAWQAECSSISKVLQQAPDVDNVRSLIAPLGMHVTPMENAAILLTAGAKVQAEFLSADGQATRFAVVLKVPPLSRGAMNDVAAIRSAIGAALADVGTSATLHIAGSTAEMMDIRTITQQDFRRVATFATVAIVLMILLVLRDLWMSLFIVGATVLSYLTTVGLTYWIFSLCGSSGLEWKVQMLLFIVLVAVGQDYSIFFAVRFAQEARNLSGPAATKRALVFTGPVISSCGLIMAATLGSTMAGDVQALVQLGFALALGMLIDTFLIRPLLLPAFIVLTGRTLRNTARFVG